jgi:trehalose 6-phosphate phosphatase
VKDLLAQVNAGVLQQIAWSNTLLAFDFDGTLAPIVADRDRAAMRARTRRLFERVCARYPVAVISGRSARDVRARLGDAAVPQVVGNHGMDRDDDGAFARDVALASAHVSVALADVPGVDLEDKGLSLALHYRASRSRRAARAAILAAVHAAPVALRVVPGKLVINALPARAPHKGDALIRARAAANADTALYLGDDVTDEDVFVLDQPGRLLSVRVGRTRATAAPWYVRDQRAVDTLLARLLALRPAPRP